MIVGLEKIDYGEIFIDNEKLLYERDKLYKIRKKTGIVFQESNKHIIGETVAESLIFGMENNRIPLEKMKKNMSKYIKTVSVFYIKTLTTSMPQILLIFKVRECIYYIFVQYNKLRFKRSRSFL